MLGVLSPPLLVAIILSSFLSYSSEPALQHEPDSHTWAVSSLDGGATKAVVEALGPGQGERSLVRPVTP